MTEYPERIWAAEDRQTHSTMWWPDDAGGVGVEYVRADRIEELQARAAAVEAKLEKAVEAFTRIDDLTCHNMPMTAREEQAVNREARAALEKLKGQTDD